MQLWLPSQHRGVDAVDKLTIKLQFGKYHYVVEADIKGYFDNIDHQRLLEMLARRVDDQALLRLIAKWLKAGVLETDGQVVQPSTGTPQGGIISPILANVYLHYALDEWFQKVVKPHCRGEACLIRYADDFVCAFENQADAQRFHEVLGKRLGKFGLELSAEKTQVIAFSVTPEPSQTSFNFLGFEFRSGKDRAGKGHVQRRTARKNLRNSLKRFNEWCRQNRHLRLPELFRQLNAKLRGYYNYYGIKDNSASLTQFYSQALPMLLKHLNQRSQRRSYNWEGFTQLLELFGVEKPRIHERPRRVGRMSATPGLA